jgi:hypothetical protein
MSEVRPVEEMEEALLPGTCKDCFSEDIACTMAGACCFGAAKGDLFAGAGGDRKLDDKEDLGTAEGVVKRDVLEAPDLLLCCCC